ncbi:quercetin dioxygenase-like cupin family protein [Roseibium hamelinense]|uniref:Quercetin dioxygenase-like cupin family protein n=1 Tax=Roseibium hamelinense TaxID=150831 RepID=A0A562T174_9HYPH|nr:cupin domain-containing protein [Roseibium hamelinense]MTI42048.1 cupin domain-containing protein [Roseibium hamelinense]TWI87361.1 quercetin dioxygenase-like cupin family protein [Roseibium hamelinense]
MTWLFSHTHADEPAVKIPEIGLEMRVRLDPAWNDGQMTIIETNNAPGFGPPLHRHRETEIFHVLNGAYLYEVDGRRFTARTGDVVTIPGGCAHAFRNETDAIASQLVIICPGLDATGFFTGLADVMKGGHLDKKTLNSFSKKWQIEFLGPPI